MPQIFVSLILDNAFIETIEAPGATPFSDQVQLLGSRVFSGEEFFEAEQEEGDVGDAFLYGAEELDFSV